MAFRKWNMFLGVEACEQRKSPNAECFNNLQTCSREFFIIFILQTEPVSSESFIFLVEDSLHPKR